MGHSVDALLGGLIYICARYYDPVIGRFISEDPSGDRQNWYAYCNDNPVNYADESGNNPEILAAVGNAILLGALVGLGVYLGDHAAGGEAMTLKGAARAALEGAFGAFAIAIVCVAVSVDPAAVLEGGVYLAMLLLGTPAGILVGISCVPLLKCSDAICEHMEAIGIALHLVDES